MTNAAAGMPVTLRWQGVRRVLMALLTALVLVQTVGVMHRVAHAPHGMGLTTHAGTQTSKAWAGIWGEHSHSAECQLFDQSCSDLLQFSVWALPVALPRVTWMADVLHVHITLFERFYAARGPPVTLI